MKVIVCVDKNNGLLFCGKRQSRDITVANDVLESGQGSRVLIHSFSEALFPAGCVVIDDALLETAGEGDYCFIEHLPLSVVADKINELIVYKWNRDYPATQFLDISLKEWKLQNTIDFPGNSHEKITKETYVRK